jgi:hypothetical protein
MLSELGIQNAALLLGDLQEDVRYRALDATEADARFNQFRRQVELVQIRCFQMYPPDKRTEPEVRGLLERLRDTCTGTLAPFRPYLDRALAALDGE